MQCTAVTGPLKFKSQVKGILLIIMKFRQYLESRRLWVRDSPEQPFFYETRKEGSQVRCLICL